MTYRGGLLTGAIGTLLVCGAAGAAWYFAIRKPAEAAKPGAPAVPATVPKPFKEDQATTFTLTPDGEVRLALRFGTVERKSVRREREYGGEVTVPPGRSVVVSAPLAGTLKPAATAPFAGLAVTRGQPVFHLLPLLDPVGRANLTASKLDADGLVQNAAEQLKLAEIALDRAKKVLAGGAGRQRDVDEAQTQVDVARKLLEATTARRNLLNKVVGEAEAGTATPMTIEAPDGGIIRSVSALAGQSVPAGATLFEVMDLDQVWVRVPVYVGDLAEIDTGRRALVGSLTGAPGGPSRAAAVVPAPPLANPAAGTVDLFYAMSNWRPDDPRWATAEAVVGFGLPGLDRSRYSPGERVGVSLSLRDPAESLTAPWDSVVFDVYGGTWVYERTAERTYTRHRVVVRYARDGLAVLASGPKAGTKVVTAGAAELFGTETGFSK
jgi:cobalt-zinc-cadmium efflux system membrane fusion protein